MKRILSQRLRSLYFIWITILALSAIAACSEEEEREKPTPFTERNRRADPNFGRYGYEIIDVVDVQERYESMQTRDAELITTIRKNRIFIMSYSYITGYIIVGFRNDEKVLDFIEALRDCRQWARGARKSTYRKPRYFYEQNEATKANYLELKGEYIGDKELYGGACILSMTDEGEDWVEEPEILHLTPKNTWELGLHLKDALRELS